MSLPRGAPAERTRREPRQRRSREIVRAILETGYDGYLGQEFIPKSSEPLQSLAEGVRICDV